MELVLGEGESPVIPTTATTTMDRVREREREDGRDTGDVKDATGNGAVDGNRSPSSNERHVPLAKMDSPASTTTNASPLDVSSLDSQSTTDERLDEEPSPSKDSPSNHAQSLPAAKNDPPRLPSDEPNHATVASTTNNTQIPSTFSTRIRSTYPPTSQNSPPDAESPLPPTNSQPLTNVDSSHAPPSIKIIDFGYVASSPLHRPLWAPPLDEDEEEELEEFEDESDEDEADEGEEGEGEGEGELELEPGLYRAVYAFEAEGASEVSLERGQVVRVVGRGGGVGWAVVLDEGEGKRRHALVPESYLVRVEEGQE